MSAGLERNLGDRLSNERDLPRHPKGFHLEVGVCPGASQDSWRPLMKHGGCNQLLVCNELDV